MRFAAISENSHVSPVRLLMARFFLLDLTSRLVSRMPTGEILTITFALPCERGCVVSQGASRAGNEHSYTIR